MKEKLTEEEKKEIITELYREYLQGMTCILLYKLKHPRVHLEEIFNLLEKRIPVEVERKKKPIIRFLSMYLKDPSYLLTREGTLKSLGEIKEELQRIFTIKSTVNSQVIYPPTFSRLERVASFHEVKDLDEIMECGTITVPKGLAIRRLGNGAGGSVYKVYRGDLKQYYALKIIPKRINEKEAELMARLKGQDLENIVQIQDAGNHLVTVSRKKEYAILMEYVDGQTIEEILKREKKLTLHEVLDYSAQILNGIKSLRRHGITHRDLKPKNIKVNTKGEIKILDFGIATDEPNPRVRGNRTGSAPKDMEADDLISFGLLVYQMATGEHLITVPGEENMGSNTRADAIDKAKQFLYQDGKIMEEYRKKIKMILTEHPSIKSLWELQQRRQKGRQEDSHFLSGGPSFDQPIDILVNREKLSNIILYALNDRDLDKLQEEYPLPYKGRMMNAEELRKLLFR